jgi:uncharacterized protein (DUF302 family)
MEYYFSAILHTNFDDAVAKITEALKTEGFGVLTEIDLQAKFKEKLGVDYKKYKILGACNPAYAYKALQAEEMIGTMLPRSIIVTDKEDGTIQVAAINPVASMMAIENPALEPLAQEVTEKLKRVISMLK